MECLHIFGLAFLMFAFALFPFPFEAEYGEQSFGSVTKDTGFVWGLLQVKISWMCHKLDVELMYSSCIEKI